MRNLKYLSILLLIIFLFNIPFISDEGLLPIVFYVALEDGISLPIEFELEEKEAEDSLPIKFHVLSRADLSMIICVSIFCSVNARLNCANGLGSMIAFRSIKHSKG
jgi:hypothetical protein